MLLWQMSDVKLILIKFTLTLMCWLTHLFDVKRSGFSIPVCSSVRYSFRSKRRGTKNLSKISGLTRVQKMLTYVDLVINKSMIIYINLRAIFLEFLYLDGFLNFLHKNCVFRKRIVLAFIWYNFDAKSAKFCRDIARAVHVHLYSTSRTTVPKYRRHDRYRP